MLVSTIAALVAVVSTPPAATAQSAAVEIRIAGAEPGGPIMLQLCTEAEFLGRCTHEGIARPDGQGRAVVRFSGVAPGRYAVGAFQDVNSNGRLDFDRMGAPTEPWGYSRDAPAVMGPAVFSDAAVRVAAPVAVIPIRLARR